MKQGCLIVSLAAMDWANNYFSMNGEIMRDGNFNVTHWARLGEKWDTGKESKHRCTNIHSAGHLGDGFFVHGDYLHATGRKWYRSHLKTMEEKELTQSVIPKQWRMRWHSSSAKPRSHWL